MSTIYKIIKFYKIINTLKNTIMKSVLIRHEI